MFNCLAIDVGAGSGRIMRCVISDEGKVSLDEVSRFPNDSRMKDGFLRWDIQKLIADIKTGLAKAAKEMKPDAVAVDTWGVDYVLLDKDGKLLNDPVCYRDERTKGLAKEFNDKFGAEKLYALTGIQVMDLNTIYQLYSEYKANPAYAAKAAHLLFTPDYIAYCLSGKMANEFTIASTSQLLDCSRGTWSQELLDAVGLPHNIVKDLTRPGTVIGDASFSGVPGMEGVPVVMVGSHDTASGVAASPAAPGADWAYIASGTWCLAGCESEVACANKLAGKFNFTNEGGVMNTWRVLKNLTGFWILRGIKAALADKQSYDEITELAKAAKPFGSLFNPNDALFFNPESMKDAVDEFFKRTGQAPLNTTGEYVRSFFESLSLLFRKTIRECDSVSGKHTKVIHLLGGGAQNPFLCQMTANATGCSVVAGPVEATALGNAMMQAIATGKLSSLKEARALIRSSFNPQVFEPDFSKTAEWDAAYARFEKLFN